MADYHSIMHCTSNEDGNEELRLEYQPTFWQSLRGQAGKVEIYIFHSTRWIDKFTCEVPDANKQAEVFEAKIAAQCTYKRY